MNLLPRSVRVALLLLAVFLALAAALQWWLVRETARLEGEAVAAQKAQLAQAVVLAGTGRAVWDDAALQKLGGLLGGQLSLMSAREAAEARPPPGLHAVTVDLPDRSGRVARLVFPPLISFRLAVLRGRVLFGTAAAALIVLAVAVAAGLFSRPRAEADEPAGTPWLRAANEMGGLTHFARLTVERGAELQRESGARQRAEEDLQVSRTLLSSSQEERARLGRELHDNICQTLYAVGLTLESVGRNMTADPETERRLEQCLAELRRLNQEVRLYLRDLEPAQIQRRTFAEALQHMLAAAPGGPEVRVVQQMDEAAVGVISTQQSAEVVNILREAISNAVRHGRARTVTLRAGRDESTVAISVQDDGSGFAAARPAAGHGLANMESRAAALGGTFKVDSAPGKGTRILLQLPVASES